MARIRKRVHMVRLMATLIMAGIIILSAASAVKAWHEDGGEKEFLVIVVERGDTLWALAERYGPRNMDTRDIIMEIQNANWLESGEIYPGQKLTIPQV